MTTFCKIENGLVTNRATFDEDMPEGWAVNGELWVADEDAQIGSTYADGVFTAPPAPPEPEPLPVVVEDPVEKLKTFLADNPAVKALLGL